MSGNYPEGDTYDDQYVPSGLAFPHLTPGSPDGRGFNPGGDAVFATGSRRVQPNGDVTTRFSGPPCFGDGDEAIDGGDA